MYHRQENRKADELKARFTSWLDILLYRARLKFIRKEAKNIPTISLDELEEETLLVPANSIFNDVFRVKSNAFEFEEERLAKAFAELPMKRQRILEMLFVEDKKPSQIAKELNCSEAYVYNQKHRALRKLREALEKEGSCYDF